MGKKRISLCNSVKYARTLISNGDDKNHACKLAAHRYDENPKAVMNMLNKKEDIIVFYEGPLYLINVKDKKDIKKTNIAIKLDSIKDTIIAKKCIEKYYSKEHYRGLIKKSDWECIHVFNNEREYKKFLEKKK